jgi:uncharacterized protein involved in exopolysaccharide biosynthesis
VLASTRRLGLPTRLYWWHILVLSLLGAALVGLVVYLAAPGTYTASSSLLLSQYGSPLTPMLHGNQPTGMEADSAVQERMWAILNSRQVRANLVTKHNLSEVYHVDEQFAGEMLARMTELQQLGGGLTVSVRCSGYHVPRMSLWADLNMEGARQLCAALANGYVTELEKYLTESSLQQASANREFIESAMAELSKQLGDSEQRLEQLRASHRLLAPDDKALQLVDRAKAAEQAHANSSAEAADLASALSKARAQLKQVEPLHVSGVTEQRNPVIGQLEAKLAELRTEMATHLSSGKTVEHRDVAQLQAAIVSVEQQLRQMEQETRKEQSKTSNPAYDGLVSRVLELESSLAGARARQTTDRALLNEAKSALDELPPVAREYATLTRQQEVHSELMASLTEAQSVAMIQEQHAQAGGKFSVLDTAVPPSRRAGPPVLLSAGIAFCVVFIGLSLFMVNRRAFGMF